MTEWICARCLTRLLGEVAGTCPSCGSVEVVPRASPRGAQLSASMTPPIAVPERAMSQSAIAVVVFSVLAAIGGFLPWVSAGVRSVSGMEGDGKIAVAVMVLASFIGVAGISRRCMTRLGGFGVLVCGIIGLTIAIVAGGHLAEIAERNAFVSMGPGLYLLGLASFILSFVGLYALVAGPRAS